MTEKGLSGLSAKSTRLRLMRAQKIRRRVIARIVTTAQSQEIIGLQNRGLLLFTRKDPFWNIFRVQPFSILIKISKKYTRRNQVGPVFLRQKRCIFGDV
jgi:hypothetical protein